MSYPYILWHNIEDAFVLIDEILSDEDRIISIHDLGHILLRLSLDLSEDSFNEKTLLNPDHIKIAFNDGQCNIANIVIELLNHVKCDS